MPSTPLPLRMHRRSLLGLAAGLGGAALLGGCGAEAPAPLEPWQQRLRTGTVAEPRRIGFLGDSISFGAGSSTPRYQNAFPGRLRSALGEVYRDGGTGWVLMNHGLWPVTSQNRGSDDRLRVTGTVTEVPAGPFRRCCFAIPDGGRTPTSHVEFTAEGRTFSTWVLGQPAGRSQQLVSVDGGAPIALRNVVAGGPAPDVDPRGGPVASHLVTDLDLGSPGRHTVRIWGSGGRCDLVAVRATTGASIYLVDNLGVSGESLQTFLGPDDPDVVSFFGLPFVDTLALDLMVVELGANDYNAGRPLDAVEADLRRLLARQRATGGDVALTFPPVSDPALHRPGTPTYTEYRDRFAAVAAAETVPFLDLTALWGPDHAASAALQPPRYADAIHPNDLGAADIAARFQAFLGL